MAGYWEELERPGPDVVALAGREVRAGSRVRLRPRAGGDILDLALDGRSAVVQAIEQDLDGQVTLAVVVEDDPGRDLGFDRQPGHRFFFSPEEVEPLDGDGPVEGLAWDGQPPRVLVAGIGNVFLGDDGFGVALVDRLARRELPDGVEAVDFGIRGMDLALAIVEGYDAVVLLDATPRGQAPGTLYVIEVEREEDDGEVALDTHGMDPVKVLALVRAFGGQPPPVYVIGCEPLTRMSPEDEEIVAELSEPVRASLDRGVELVQSLLAEISERSAQPGLAKPQRGRS